VRDLGTIDQMAALAKVMEGRRLRYANLIEGTRCVDSERGNLILRRMLPFRHKWWVSSYTGIGLR